MNKLTKLTPVEIVKQQCTYSIPIYQRLFEWDEENIRTLLNDLYKSFSPSKEKNQSKEVDYYIGMLTSTANNELVDGQQRFTVMMLMGCVFQDYYEKWKDFLHFGENSESVRLYFSSRPADNTYLQTLIDKENKETANSPSFINKKMDIGVKVVEKYLEDNEKFPPSSNNRKDFAKYVYEHLCFFVTELSEKYNARDLNTYFERMNTTGRNLELHEILKVKLLSNLGSSERYMSLWNKLADVDEPLITKSDKSNAFQDAGQLDQFINAIEDQEKEGKVDFTIGEMQKSDTKPEKKTVIKDSRCVLTFPYLLLQALYYFKGGKIEGTIEDFFNPSNLLDTFAKHLPYEGDNKNEKDIEYFLQTLVRSKLALDICFVRPTESGYSLDMDYDENKDETNKEDLNTLLMYESMLYVSSSNVTHYRWFGWLMEEIEKAEYNIPNVKTLFEDLKSNDEKLHLLPTYDELSYGNVDRYWFWKLDFYIWQHRKELFKDSKKALKVVDNYVFRRNRSLEHIAPQTPKSNSTLQWKDNDEEETKLRNSFGNLVMISQSLNSALQNESYEVKRAHVESYINGSKSGSIESLKLLCAYVDYKTWDKKSTAEHGTIPIVEHGEKMHDFLKKSFGS